MTTDDLSAYRALVKAPTHSTYRGMDVYGMPVPSQRRDRRRRDPQPASRPTTSARAPRPPRSTTCSTSTGSPRRRATAFADRNRYVGDVPGVPTPSCSRRPSPTSAPACSTRPGRSRDRCRSARPTARTPSVAPRHPPARSPTTTSRRPTSRSSTAGATRCPTPRRSSRPAARASPSRAAGFLLNNELTDFNFAPLTAGVPDPNLPGPGKRPRSSMSPTMVVDDGTLELVAGSPGGASIITTVAQIVLGHYERGLPVGDALAAPRLSSRNGASEQAEPAIATGPLGAGLTALGHRAGEHRRDRCGHGRPGARHRPLRRRGRAVTARRRLRDGGRPGGVTTVSTRAPRGARLSSVRQR